MNPALVLAFRGLSARWPDAVLHADRVVIPSLGVTVTRPPAHRRQLHLQWQATHTAADVVSDGPVSAVLSLLRALGASCPDCDTTNHHHAATCRRG